MTDPKSVPCVAELNDCKRLPPERSEPSEPNGLLRRLIVAVLQAAKLGQHSPGAIGAIVPSGQILISMVHITKPQSEIGLIGLTGLQADNDGQHPLAGTGAGLPSGQILRSMVQKVLIQFGLNGKIAP